MGQCFGNKLHTLHPMVWCFILNIKHANSDSGSVDLPQADGGYLLHLSSTVLLIKIHSDRLVINTCLC